MKERRHLMTPAEARHVTFSFGRVFPYKNKLTTLFYDTLFEMAPEARPLFPDDMSGQKDKLAHTLNLVVTNLNKLDGILAAVRALGERHKGYGATAAHYEVVGIALVTALKQVTPGGLSAEEEQAWVTAYQLIASAMVEAADAAPDVAKTA
ncbi:MAG: globin domain-containing protein [Pseudomonadota bacterium]